MNNDSYLRRCNIDFDEELKHIFKTAMEFEPNFQKTDANIELYKILLLYFTGNPKFEKIKLPGSGNYGSLKKGLFISGDVGSGKTFALTKVFKEYTSVQRCNSYKIFYYMDLKQDYEAYGSSALSPLNKKIIISNGIRYNETPTVLIDDFLANGAKLMYFGNRINLANELILKRYNVYEEFGRLTHLTTNLDGDDLTELLDERVLSRLNGMCNIIRFDDVDWRRK